MKTSYDVMLHIPSLKGGGAERVAVELARYFVRQGKSTAFFIHDEEIAYDLPSGIDIFFARSTGHLGRVAEFRSLIIRLKVSVVLSFLPYANLISIFAFIGCRSRPKLLISEHLSYSGFVPSGISERVKFALLRSVYQISDVIVAVSSGVAAELRTRLFGSAIRKVVVIHNPCYIPAARAKHSTDDVGNYTVLAVGRLTPQKGFDTLIAAFAIVKKSLPSARLVIVGEGPERLKLKAQIAQLNLGDSVVLPGFTRKIFDEYERANLFVCSSRTEGFGNVIVEALSFGLPIVSTDCPYGPKEILDCGRYGTLVAVDDDIELANAMINTLATHVDPEMQVARARDFSLDTIGAQYMQIMGFSG
jgi:glycosyltransferase involved in cell wall biosynthesis